MNQIQIASLGTDILYQIMRLLPLKDRLNLLIIPGAIEAFDIDAPSAFVVKYGINSIQKLLKWKSDNKIFCERVFNLITPEHFSHVGNLAVSMGQWDIVEFLVNHGLNASLLKYSFQRAEFHKNTDELDKLNELFKGKNGFNNIESFKPEYMTLDELNSLLEDDIPGYNHFPAAEYLDNLLITASGVGSIELVDSLIRLGCDIHICDDFAIFHATSRGCFPIVEQLLISGANIKADDDQSFRAAAAEGYTDIVELLIEYGADIRLKEYLALRLAARNGHVDTVRVLIQAGSDVNARETGALRNASERGNLEIVQLLLANGANIHAKQNEALRRAAQCGDLAMVELLLKNGADIHANNDDALRLAVRNGHKSVAKLLVEMGANVDAIEESLLRWAANRYK